MTEDMMQEQQSVLAKLGTSEQAAKVRAKMQSSSLISDMQAFKAANPGCLLEDFVRWYSPRDWVQSDTPSPTLPQGGGEGGVAEEGEGGEKEDVGAAGEEGVDVAGKEEVGVAGKEEVGVAGKEEVGVAGKEVVGVAGKEEVGVVAGKEEVGVTEEEEVGVAGEEKENEEEVKSKPRLSSRLAMQEGASSDGDWEEDGWGQDDWDVIITEDDTATEQPNEKLLEKRVRLDLIKDPLIYGQPLYKGQPLNKGQL